MTLTFPFSDFKGGLSDRHVDSDEKFPNQHFREKKRRHLPVSIRPNPNFHSLSLGCSRWDENPEPDIAGNDFLAQRRRIFNFLEDQTPADQKALLSSPEGRS
jgi:hypothetical protein